MNCPTCGHAISTVLTKDLPDGKVLQTAGVKYIPPSSSTLSGGTAYNLKPTLREDPSSPEEDSLDIGDIIDGGIVDGIVSETCREDGLNHAWREKHEPVPTYLRWIAPVVLVIFVGFLIYALSHPIH